MRNVTVYQGSATFGLIFLWRKPGRSFSRKVHQCFVFVTVIFMLNRSEPLFLLVLAWIHPSMHFLNLLNPFQVQGVAEFVRDFKANIFSYTFKTPYILVLRYFLWLIPLQMCSFIIDWDIDSLKWKSPFSLLSISKGEKKSMFLFFHFLMFLNFPFHSILMYIWSGIGRWHTNSKLLLDSIRNTTEGKKKSF